MRRALLTGAVLCALFASSEAHAQYKNMSFGFYAGGGYWFPAENTNYYREFVSTNGTFVDASGSVASGTPYRRFNPFFHLEFNFKVGSDFSWWLKTGIGFGILGLVEDLGVGLDANGQSLGAGGAGLMVELTLAPRYYFLTDNIRPYLEIGVRVPIPGVVVFSSSNNALPQNLKAFPGVYANFGFEFFVARDIALSIVAGYTRFILINYYGFNSLDAKFGILFYL